MRKEPVTWDVSGKVVALTEDEVLRQSGEAKVLWDESGSGIAKTAQIVPSSWDTGFWMILRDLGDLGVEVLPSVSADKPRLSIWTPQGNVFLLVFYVFVFVLAIVLLPLSFLLRQIGRSGYAASLRRAAVREKALERMPD